MPTDVEHFLEAGKGEPLMFFDSYDALKFFFVHSLKWEDDEETLLPELAEFDNFVVYGNPKGVLVARMLPNTLQQGIIRCMTLRQRRRKHTRCSVKGDCARSIC